MPPKFCLWQCLAMQHIDAFCALWRASWSATFGWSQVEVNAITPIDLVYAVRTENVRRSFINDEQKHEASPA